jgi:hypothetical protein
MFDQSVTLNAVGMPLNVTVAFTPPSVKPPAGSVANAMMRIHVGWNVSNVTYALTITGTSVACTGCAEPTRSVPFTLIILEEPNVRFAGVVQKMWYDWSRSRQ